MSIQNSVVIVIDALRYDRISPYNGDSSLTPNIDTLVRDGSLFSNAFTTINATDPAMTSLHTGLYPLSHGVINHGKRVTSEEKSIVENRNQFPELLQQEGIKTIKIGRPLGRWHKKGFDRYPEFSPPHISLKGKISKMLYKISPKLRNIIADIYLSVDRKSEGKVETKPCKKFRKEISDEPFYSTVHLMDTHIPYSPDSDLVEKYLEKYSYENTPMSEVINNLSEGSNWRDSIKEWMKEDRNKKWEKTKYGFGTAVMKARYDAAVHEADQKIGEIISELKERGVFDETLLIIMSDHGESLDEHNIYFDHHGLYDCTVQIPLVVHTPDEQKQNIEELVQITDIAPTVLDYLIGTNSFECDGQTLRPLIEDSEGWSTRRGVIAEEAHTQRRRMIRTHDEKYIFSLDGDTECRNCGIEHAPEEELYNLTPDPDEVENIVDEFPEKAERLQQMCQEIVDKYSKDVSEENREQEVEYDDEEELIDHLDKLGYR